MEDEILLNYAIQAREHSYAPYSKFKVGAALLAEDDSIYLGCNIENAAYTPTNCAERTAFFKAVSEGQHNFKKIAIVGGSNKLIVTPPCGVCRQVMLEFCDPSKFEIILGTSKKDLKKYTLQELMPAAFFKDSLDS
ncbi:cytidine deaminase [Lachnospiraceae bacterium KM106-2]|nr:cytidine deaminase [Lachnospiraceae bacterium KM106-2]